MLPQSKYATLHKYHFKLNKYILQIGQIRLSQRGINLTKCTPLPFPFLSVKNLPNVFRKWSLKANVQPYTICIATKRSIYFFTQGYTFSTDSAKNPKYLAVFGNSVNSLLECFWSDIMWTPYLCVILMDDKLDLNFLVVGKTNATILELTTSLLSGKLMSKVRN